MSGEIEKMTDGEIIKWQEELYELEEQAGGVFAGSPMTEAEKMERIRAFLADDYLEQLYAKVQAKKRQLISAATTAEEKQRLSLKLIELERTEKELAEKLAARSG
jgi:isocitrate dehydrogenase